MVQAPKWESASNGKEEHSSDADLEVGDEETTASTQYSNGQAHHSSSSASVKVSLREKGGAREGEAEPARKRNARASFSVYVCWARPRHNLVRVCVSRETL